MITRTIYTQANVAISGFGISGNVLSGVQSAGFSSSTPRQDVNSFGVLGSINKIQLEAQTAQLEVSMCLTDANTGIFPLLIGNSQEANPSYYTISVSGVGRLYNAVLSSLSLESAVGAIPTITLSFDGQSGTYLSGQNAPVIANLSTLKVYTPDLITGIQSSGGTICAQKINLSWEMPNQRFNCLGQPINSPTIFSTFPGNGSFQIEGTQDPYLVTGLQFGPHNITFPAAREVSRTRNVAVGDAYASYNLSEEFNGLDMLISEIPSYDSIIGESTSKLGGYYVPMGVFYPKGQYATLNYGISAGPGAGTISFTLVYRDSKGNIKSFDVTKFPETLGMQTCPPDTDNYMTTQGVIPENLELVIQTYFPVSGVYVYAAEVYT